MSQRPPLSQKIRMEIMYMSSFACAVCQSKGDQIHHIDKNNANNVPDNLIFLCQKHHDEAHTTREISVNLSAKRLKAFRKKWNETVETHRVRVASAYDQSHWSESLCTNATWACINHARLIQSVSKKMIMDVNPLLLSRLMAAGIIDENGILVKPDTFTPSETYLRNTIYHWYEYTDSIALHMFYSELVDHFVRENKVIHLDETNWNRTFIKQMIGPGDYIFINKAQYFKKGYEDIMNAEVDVYTFKRKIRIEYQVNTRNMFGMSSMTSSFVGHRSCASLLQVKSIEDVGTDRVIYCTPFALGVGFNSTIGDIDMLN
jgi:hypothetical protein